MDKLLGTTTMVTRLSVVILIKRIELVIMTLKRLLPFVNLNKIG